MTNNNADFLVIDQIIKHLNENNTIATLSVLSYGHELYRRDPVVTGNIYECYFDLTNQRDLTADLAEIKHLTTNKTYFFTTLTSSANSKQSLTDLINLSDLLLADDVSNTWQRHAYQLAFDKQIITSLVIHNDQQPHLVYLGMPIADEIYDKTKVKNQDPNFNNLAQIQQLETITAPAQTYLKQITKISSNLDKTALAKQLTIMFNQQLKRLIAYYQQQEKDTPFGFEQPPSCILLDLNWLTTQNAKSHKYQLTNNSEIQPETAAVLKYLAQKIS